MDERSLSLLQNLSLAESQITVKGKPWLPLRPDRPVFNEFDYIDKAFPAESDEVNYLIENVQHKRYKLDQLGHLVMLQAIDPITGDSVLHQAIRDNQPAGFLQLMEQFAYSRSRWHIWAEHALLTHQNHTGDTILHVAARTGNRNLLVTIYRQFNDHWSAARPELMEMVDGPPPELRRYPDDFYDDFADPPLQFLLMTNQQGNTARDEAQIAGHYHIAQWLEDVVKRLDPEGTRATEAGIVVLNRNINDMFHYKEMVGEDYY